MGITNSLSKIFDFNNIEYHYTENSIPDSYQDTWIVNAPKLNNVASTILLKTTESIIFAIIPASHHINLAKLVNILNKPVHYLNVSEIHSFQDQCEEQEMSEIIANHNIQVIIDLEVSDLNEVHFKNNSKNHYLSVNSINLEKTNRQRANWLSVFRS